MHFGTSADMVACLSLCKSTEGCAWFSFQTTVDIGQTSCILFEDCPEIDTNPEFVSGQKECEYGNSEYKLAYHNFTNIITHDINILNDFYIFHRWQILACWRFCW